MNPLRALNERGQSVWLDFLSREFIRSGGLERLVREDRLSGVTSNPSIFEKAIGESTQYDADIERAVAASDPSVTAVYESLAIADIRNAADVLRRVHDATAARDGFVSLEVSPYLANDTEATIAEARRLWRSVDRDNVMIKVPATPAGLPAIRQLVGEGININITLLFSQQVYEEVVEAYLSGLERLAAERRPLGRLASVASFFVSRIDTVADKLLAEKLAHAADADQRAIVERLRGKVAIANAKLAYQRYHRRFSGPRWERLAALGARPQRLLWGSTGTKNPAYSDVLYVAELIGPDTVNTMPPKTMDAFRDHGQARDTLAADLDAAAETIARLERIGIFLDEVTAELVVDGVQQFSDAFDKLLAAVAGKRRRVLGAKLDGQALAVGEARQADLDKMLDAWRSSGKVRRLWRKDATLWTGHGEEAWLGWLDAVDRSLRQVDELRVFAEEVRAERFSDVLLLGMGGSSLGPEVVARTLGSAPGFPVLHALDSTDPQQIRSFEKRIDPARTLFIVSSKSGTTLEPNILMDYFLACAGEAVGRDRAARRFIAITDPGSELQKLAQDKGFRRVFFGEPGIGGRYSVLSAFGLVPLALTGHDVRGFLENTMRMVRTCAADVPPAENFGVGLGLAMGMLGAQGRDKVTIVASPSVGTFGAWAEQLIAESTGKNGHGLIPVDAEPLGEPSVYGGDRLFVYVRDAGGADAAQDRAIDALEHAGHPIVRISLARADQIGQEFFRFEVAIAVAGAVLGINPFDQPDVEASKIASRELTESYEKRGALPAETPVFRENGIALFTDAGNARALEQAGANSTLAGWLRAHFSRLNPGDYFAALAYVERNDAHVALLQKMRVAVRDRKHAATCVGFGPRFLHSTGQAYKGGPNTGVFLQITADAMPDLEIPGRRASFGIVEAAQARGDLRVLAERGRRVLRAHLDRNVETGLAALGAAVREALP